MAGREYYKIIPASYVVIMQNDKVLLLQRANTGFKDGYYSLPAGHLDGNETATVAAIREAEEEAGILINPEDIEVRLTMHRINEESERVDFFLVADKWAGDIINAEPHKCSDLSFFPLSNLPDNIIPYVKHAIDCILQGVTYTEYGWNNPENTGFK